MSENNDYIQLPPLKKDTPADVVAFMWEYMKVPEDSREKVKNLLKDANENSVRTTQIIQQTDKMPKQETPQIPPKPVMSAEATAYPKLLKIL